MTIYFIQFDKPFTLIFTKNRLEETEAFLKKFIQDVNACKCPKLLNTFFCNRICYYGKTKFQELYPTYQGEETICQYLHCELLKKGMDYIVEHFTQKGFKLGHYQSPGT